MAAIIVAAPVFWMLSQFNWQNYIDVFTKVPFARYLFNSFFVTTTVTLLSLLFHSMAAYSLARLRYPGRRILFVVILSTLMVPFTAIVSIPSELEDAAFVDGANLAQVYWHIVLPLSRPVLAALGIFIFLYNWNSFLWPLVVTQSPDLRVAQLGVMQFTGQFVTRWNVLMAASTVAALPTLVLFVILQRRLVEGIKLSGLKG